MKWGSPIKQPLTKSPFVVKFEYGVSGQGYWCYEHMVLQVNDCTIVLKVNFPEIDFLFMLDHSCGHDKQRESGLNAENMHKQEFWWKTKQTTWHDNKTRDRLPWPTSALSASRRCQKLSFHEDDEGPFWMPLEQ